MRRTTLAMIAAIAVGASLATTPATAAPTVEHGVMSSFDGTPIAYSIFIPTGATRSQPVPVIFNSHGWGGNRAHEPTGFLGELLAQGYGVLTWDARGFGESGGEANVDSQQFEVGDVRGLIDLIARRPEIQLDAPGDPRMGMFGVSYAGGIQLMTASVDDRIDAIAPQIAWNDLVRSLKPGGVLKLGWGSLLYGAGLPGASTGGLQSRAGPQTGVYARQIHQAYAESLAINDWTPETKRWFDARSPKHYIEGIDIPTLIIQGTSDTLFTPNEGIANYEAIRGNAEARLMFYCGGHTVTPDTSCEAGDSADVIDDRVAAWFDRHVRDPLGDAPADEPITYQLQDGSFDTIQGLPTSTVRAAGSGRLVNTVAPTSGALAAGTPSRDGVRFSVPVDEGRTILGIPRAQVSVTGVGTEATLFLKLLDVGPDGTVVIDDQVAAHKVMALPSRFEMDLIGVSWRVEDGHSIAVEISATSNDHNSSRVPWTVEVEATVDVPVVAEARVLGGSFDAPDRGRVLPATGLATSAWPATLFVAAVLLATAIRRQSR